MLRKRGINPNDETAVRLYQAAIEGASKTRAEVIHRACKANGVITSEGAPKHIEELAHESDLLFNATVRKTLTATYYKPIFLSILTDLLSNYQNEPRKYELKKRVPSFQERLLQMVQYPLNNDLSMVFKHDEVQNGSIDPLGRIDFDIQT